MSGTTNFCSPFGPTASSWTAEKTMSIDWMNPSDILSNHFTFLEMLSAHPALAEKYTLENGQSNALNNSLSREALKAERQRIKQLFLSPPDVNDMDLLESPNDDALADGGAGAGTLSSSTAEKIALLREWAAEQLFTLRTARWCRHCGCEGHTLLHCPVRKQVRQRARCAAAAVVAGRRKRARDNDLVAQGDAAVSIKQEPQEDGSEEPPPLSASGGAVGGEVAADEEADQVEGGRMSALQKYHAHQQALEKARLLEEKKKKVQNQRNNSKVMDDEEGSNASNSAANAQRKAFIPDYLQGQSGPQQRGGGRELELFSDERRLGVVERLDPANNIGMVRHKTIAGRSAEYRFFIDRSDCGVKPLRVGDNVTFKVDSGRDYPMAADVRPDAPVITEEDVKAFMGQCRLAGSQSNTMELISMLVSHMTEWQDVLRHIYRASLQPVEMTRAAPLSPSTCLPTWVSHIQTITELTTFHTNREPVHRSILIAFLKLLIMPVKPTPSTSAAGAGGRATDSGTPSNSNPASPNSTPLPQGANGRAAAGAGTPIRFFPDLFDQVLTHWIGVVVPTALHLPASAMMAEEKQNEQEDGSSARQKRDLTEEEEEEWLPYIVDALCEISDFVVLVQQHTSDLDPVRFIQPMHHRLCAAIRGMIASTSSSRPSGTHPLSIRRLQAALIRLGKLTFVSPSSASRSGSSTNTSSITLATIPTEVELAIPPVYPGSVFHPTQLPVQRMANEPLGAAGDSEEEKKKAYAAYASTEAFIMSHCRLLRADTFEATARVLAASCFNLAEYPPDASTVADVAHAALYSEVRFMGRVLPRDRDYAHPMGYLFQVKPLSENANLQNKLHQGSCVCFVTSLHPERLAPEEGSSTGSVPEIFWGIISTCDAVLLRAGVICVSPCTTSSTDTAPPFSQLLQNLSRNHQAGRLDRCLMLETPIFYAGYAGIMNSLRSFLGPLAMPLPLASELIGPLGAAASTDSSSLTTTTTGAGDASSDRPYLPYIPNHCGQAFKKIIYTIRNSCKLDEGQDKVMEVLPHQGVLLVQGPPGTGKSFIGCRVVEAYVRYKQMVASGDILQHISISALNDAGNGVKSTCGPAAKASSSEQLLPPLSPIVVITYKNHALDEFLVDLLNTQLWGGGTGGGQSSTSSSAAGMHQTKEGFPGGQRLVRIGGRSRETRLDPFNMASLMREKADKSIITRYREHIGILHQRLDRLTREIHYLENGKVPKLYFEKWLTKEQRSHLKYEERDEWLQGSGYLGSEEEIMQGIKVTPPDRHYYKTLLKTALDAALEEAVQAHQAEMEKARAAAKLTAAEERATKLRKTEGALTTVLSQELEAEAVAKLVAEVIPDEDEDVSRSIFQEMKREDENREFNNRLHNFVLSPEAIRLALHPPSMPGKVPANLLSPWSLDPTTRHHFYAYLIQKAIAEKASQCFQIINRITNFLTIRNHALEMAKLSLLRAADVVGLTTTGCAMNQNLLRSLRPRVLVVEEAAEVLESQLLACVTDSLQQIILIGDHFQLQPKVETFSYEKVNHMNLSLFERLSGHTPVIRLTEQRRMHPEISRLVRTFYADQELLDHPLLFTRSLITGSGRSCVDHVPGLARRVFFWRHRYPEECAPGGSRSKVNLQEVEMVHQVVSHIVSEGILQRSITVITPYLGQCRMLRSHLRLTQLADVRVSTVDLFQGDESDVIVLSLVRTNRLTEFLRMRNRLVVSCSRARFAMVMIGSDEILYQSEHWSTLLKQMKETNGVGDKLPITTQTESGERRISYLTARRPASSGKSPTPRRSPERVIHDGKDGAAKVEQTA